MFDSPLASSPTNPVAQSPRLLDQLRQVALAHFGRPEPGDRFADWSRRFILFHGKRHPRDMGLAEIARFLEHLAQTEKDPLGALEQAREALDFLYGRLFGVHIGDLPFPEPPKLLDRLRRALRVRHYSPRTEECYVDWVERFIRFHSLRHSNTIGAPEIEQFLTDQAVNGYVSASRQNQGLYALLFLYGHVLGIELPRIDAVRAKRPFRMPMVLAPEEVHLVLDAIQGAGARVPARRAGIRLAIPLRIETALP